MGVVQVARIYATMVHGAADPLLKAVHDRLEAAVAVLKHLDTARVPDTSSGASDPKASSASFEAAASAFKVSSMV